MLRAASVRLSRGGFGVAGSQHKGFVWRSSPSAAAPRWDGPNGSSPELLAGPGFESTGVRRVVEL